MMIKEISTDNTNNETSFIITSLTSKDKLFIKMERHENAME